ncbi:hypothetical protein SRB5_49420 [Streptomyces sp. RB5]|uniref:Uncharacterized protein n=1 Tax=Streptomyces smaragdinus TaxID=2585196 RepID=A0A7K0CMQ9_9ACTN|nr:hypothetical protein [Streptomyces smaragdinus]MQY14766.1 hypothetical protein [Streptomyces smaragdinus]
MPVLLERIAHVPAPAPGHGGTTPADLLEHALDLEVLYGPHKNLDWLELGERVSYADLAEAVAGQLGDDSGVDMLVTVTALPDCQARLLPGALLAIRLGGMPLVLGVNDQGAAGPFTALRLAANHLASGRFRRAAVVLMEQSTHPPEASYTPPPRAGAVVLVLGTDAGRPMDGLSVRRIPPAERRPTPRAGHLQPWYELARRHAGQPAADLAVTDRDDELGYDCRVRFTAPTTDRLVPALTLEARP